MDTFDKQTDIAQNSSTHKVLSFEKDRDKVLRELVDTSVFQEIGYRQHNSFQNFKTNQMRNLNKKKFDEWMLKRLRIISLTSEQSTPIPNAMVEITIRRDNIPVKRLTISVLIES